MLWDTYCFGVLTLNCTMGIVYLLFSSCKRTQCRGLGTNTCLYFHSCNLIIVNHFCSGPPRRTLRGCRWCPRNKLVSELKLPIGFMRVRGPTKNCGLPNGFSVARL